MKHFLQKHKEDFLYRTERNIDHHFKSVYKEYYLLSTAPYLVKELFRLRKCRNQIRLCFSLCFAGSIIIVFYAIGVIFIRHSLGEWAPITMIIAGSLSACLLFNPGTFEKSLEVFNTKIQAIKEILWENDWDSEGKRIF